MISRRQRFRLCHLGAAALILFVLWTGFLYSIGASWRAWRQLGFGTLWTLHNADRIEALRIEPQKNLTSSIASMYGHKVVERGVTLSSDNANTFRTTVLRSRNEGNKDCTPRFGVALRVWA